MELNTDGTKYTVQKYHNDLWLWTQRPDDASRAGTAYGRPSQLHEGAVPVAAALPSGEGVGARQFLPLLRREGGASLSSYSAGACRFRRC